MKVLTTIAFLIIATFGTYAIAYGLTKLYFKVKGLEWEGSVASQIFPSQQEVKEKMVKKASSSSNNDNTWWG